MECQAVAAEPSQHPPRAVGVGCVVRVYCNRHDKNHRKHLPDFCRIIDHFSGISRINPNDRWFRGEVTDLRDCEVLVRCDEIETPAWVKQETPMIVPENSGCVLQVDLSQHSVLAEFRVLWVLSCGLVEF